MLGAAWWPLLPAFVLGEPADGIAVRRQHDIRVPASTLSHALSSGQVQPLCARPPGRPPRGWTHWFCHILARVSHQLLASGTASCLGAEGGSGPCHCHGSPRHDPPWQDPGRRGSQRRACTQGQPALLYLIPCTLGTLWVLAWHRGESALLWRRDVAAEALEHARKSHAPDRPDEEAGADPAHLGALQPISCGKTQEVAL